MTIAARIAKIVRGSSAASLYAGYCLRPNDRGGVDTIRFPTGHQEIERRNSEGRCVMARYHYADGSRLVFRWSQSRGSTFTAGA